MNQSGQEAFAGPGLALDEHRGQSASIPLPFQEPHDLVPDRLDAGALTQEVSQVLHQRQPCYSPVSVVFNS